MNHAVNVDDVMLLAMYGSAFCFVLVICGLLADWLQARAARRRRRNERVAPFVDLGE